MANKTADNIRSSRHWHRRRRWDAPFEPLKGGHPPSVSVMFREAIRRLEHDDARKLGQGGFGPFPDPDRDIFGRGVFEPLDIVQITMVEPLKQRFEGGLDREEIRDNAGKGMDRTLKSQLHAIC